MRNYFTAVASLPPSSQQTFSGENMRTAVVRGERDTGTVAAVLPDWLECNTAKSLRLPSAHGRGSIVLARPESMSP